MKNLIIFPKPIYPNIDLELSTRIKSTLSRYGIEIRFLIDSGIAFYYREDLKPIFGYSGDLCFVKSTDNSIVIISFTENFGELEFRNFSDEVILTIPIFD